MGVLSLSETPLVSEGSSEESSGESSDAPPGGSPRRAVRTDALTDLRRRMAVMSGRADQRAPESRDRSTEVLALPDALSELLPHSGLARGTVTGFAGANSVLIAMIAAVTRGGGQVGIVGLPRMGLLPAVELGADLSRIATVPDPGADPVEVAAVLLDGMDLVVLGMRGVEVAPSRARVVMGRVRKQSSVLMPVGGDWPGAQTRITAEVLTYRHCPAEPGLDLARARNGHGRIGGMRIQVTAAGRGRQPSTVEVDLLTRGAGSGAAVRLLRADGDQTMLAVAN